MFSSFGSSGWSAIISAAGNLLGNVLSNKANQSAASNASSTELQAATLADQTQLAMFQKEQDDLAPYQAMGVSAGDALTHLLGLAPPANSGTGDNGNGPNSRGVGSSPGGGGPSSYKIHAEGGIGAGGGSGNLGAAGRGRGTAGGGQGIFSASFPGNNSSISLPDSNLSSSSPESITIPGTTITGSSPSTYKTLGGILGGALFGPLGSIAGGLIGSQFNRGGQLSPTSVSLPSQTFQLPQPVDTSNLSPVGTSSTDFKILPPGPVSLVARGGPIGAGPYIVGEHGEEILHNKYGAHVVGKNGPQVIYPTVPGFVQPNPKTAAVNKEAAKNFAKAARMSPIHRFLGGGIGGTVPRDGEPSQEVPPPAPAQNPVSPDQTLQRLGTGFNQSTADSTASQVLQQSPQYQFAMQQGIAGLDSSAAASGGLLSGGHLAAILNYSQGLASQQYNNVYNQLLGVTSMGEAAAAGAATNAAVTGSGVSSNQMTLGSEQATNAYASGNSSSNMWNSIMAGLGSSYSQWRGG